MNSIISNHSNYNQLHYNDNNQDPSKDTLNEGHGEIFSTSDPPEDLKTIDNPKVLSAPNQNRVDCPFNNLPTEILCLIFSQLQDLSDQQKDLLFLVEKRWIPCVLESLNFSDNPPKRFMRACKAGSSLAVQKILKSDLDKQAALKTAAAQGNLLAFQLLLADTGLDPSLNKNEFIQLAAQNGHTHLVRFLMADLRVNPLRKDAKHHPYKFEELNHAITLAAQNGQTEVLKVFLSYPHLSPRTQALHAAIQNGHWQAVKVLLLDRRAHVNLNLLKTAARGGFAKIVQLLLADVRINPTGKSAETFKILQSHLEAISQAVKQGHTEVIRAFLADKRYDFSLSRDDRKIINEAAKGGHHQMMALLINDARFSHLGGIQLNHPINQSLLDWACFNGFDDVLKVLLKNPLVNPAATDNQALKLASQKGHAKVVELLIKDLRVNPAANHQEAFISAVSNNDLAVVLTFLRCERMKPEANHNHALYLASEKGYAEIVEALLQNPAVDPSDQHHAAVMSAVENNHFKVVEILIASGRVNKEIYPLLMKKAAEKGHSEIVAILLPYLKHTDLSEAFHAAVEKDYAEVVATLLPYLNQGNLSDALIASVEKNHPKTLKVLRDCGKVDFTISNNYPIRIASELGYTEVVEILLSHQDVNPSVDNNIALQLAAIKKYQRIVELIVQHKRFDPSLNDYAMMTIAALQRNEELFLQIVSNKDFDPSVNESEAICLAAAYRFPKAMEFLLKDKRANPATRQNYSKMLANQIEVAIPGQSKKGIYFKTFKRVGEPSQEEYPLRIAIEQGDEKIVQLLLADGRANPAANGQELFILALKKGNPAIIKLILEDKRINPNFNNNWPLHWAVDNRYIKTLEVLLTHPDIDPWIKLNAYSVKQGYPSSLIYWATEHGYVEVVKRLVTHPKVQEVIYTKDYYDKLNEYACKLEHECGCNAYKFDKDFIDNPYIRDRNVQGYRGQHYFAWKDHEEIRDLIQIHYSKYKKWLLKLHGDFIAAIRKGDEETLKSCLAHKQLDPNFNNRQGLKLAAENDRPPIVELLLADSRIDPNVYISSCEHLIHWSIHHGYMGIVKHLVEEPKAQQVLYQSDSYNKLQHYLTEVERRIKFKRGQQNVTELTLQQMRNLIEENYSKFKQRQEPIPGKVQDKND